MGLLLFAVFILLPLAELYVIIQVGNAIGAGPTIALLLLDSLLGAWLLRRQGGQAWRRFNAAMSEGRMPAREIVDGALIIFGGALLLTPGFITDILGFLLLIPPGRAVVRGVLRSAAARTTPGKPVFFVYDRFGSRGGRGSQPSQQAPGTPPRPDAAAPGVRRDYDFEGSAREVGEDEPSLPPGHGRRRGCLSD